MRAGFTKKILAFALCVTLGLSSTLIAIADEETHVITGGLEEAGVSDGNQTDEEEGNVSDNDHTVSGNELTVSGNALLFPAYSGSYSDGRVNIEVNAAIGILPAGVELSVTPIEKQEVHDGMSDEEKSQKEAVNAMYEETAALLEAETDEEEELQAFVAYDISFLKDGEEIEPKGYVEVVMDFVSAVLPEGVTEDAVIGVSHLKKDESSDTGIVVEDITPAASVETADDGLSVEKVAYASDSFSTFVIYWGDDKNKKNHVTVYYVDVNGTELESYKAKDIECDEGDYITLASLAGEIPGYIYKEARINSYKDGTVVQQLRCDKNGKNYNWSYKNGGDTKNIDAWRNSEHQKHVYLIFTVSDELTKVATVDSRKDGIVMRMIDYATAADGLSDKIGGGYGAGNVKQNLLQRVLDGQGYPVTKGGTGLSKLFEGGRDVNHLFLQSTYDATGYYEYSSFENYAYLESNGDFTVYEQIGTPETNKLEEKYYFWRGNFMPYNKILPGKLSTHTNLFDENGNVLDRNHPRYDEKLYKTQGTNNFYFGMYLEANFRQLEDGKVSQNGSAKPMVYEFNGDDDLWVYIDDVLVLDIGGIHDAHSGYIDFNTGKVHVEIGRANNQNITSDTTIRAMFREAGRFPDGSKWNDRNADKYFKGDTLADYTAHNMKMFYMERGAGASNLHMKFNLPIIPEGQIQVRKELAQETDPVKYGDVNFGFELYVENSKDGVGQGTYHQVTDLAGYDAVKVGSDNETETSLSLDSKGRFFLKPNETAVFNNIPKNLKYYVKEVEVQSDEYDKVVIDVVTVIDKYEDSEINVTYEAESTKDTVGHRPQVTFTNSCSAKNLRTLSVEKVMAGTQTSGDTFTMTIELEDESGTLQPYTGGAVLFTAGGGKGRNITIENGKVELKQNEKVCIYNIISGTEFKVTEEDPGVVYLRPQITVEGSEAPSLEGALGSIQLGRDAAVTVINSFDSGEITFRKQAFHSLIMMEGIVFELYQDGRLISSAVSDTEGRVSFKDIPYGVYTMTEPNVPEGYNKAPEWTVTLSPSGVEIREAAGSGAEYDGSTVQYDDRDGSWMVYNKEKTRGFTFHKRSDDITLQNLSGAVFRARIVGSEAEWEELIAVSDKDGNVTFENKLLYGFTYEVWEETPLADHNVSADRWLLEIGMDGSARMYKKGDANKVSVTEVVNEIKRGNLEIVKYVDKVDTSKGDAVFTFRIERLGDGDQVLGTWYRTLRFTESGENLSDKVIMTDLPVGSYRVTELETLRYEAEGNVYVKDAEVAELKTSSVAFRNKLVNEKFDSDTDMIVNAFGLDENGNIIIYRREQ